MADTTGTRRGAKSKIAAPSPVAFNTQTPGSPRSEENPATMEMMWSILLQIRDELAVFKEEVRLQATQLTELERRIKTDKLISETTVETQRSAHFHTLAQIRDIQELSDGTGPTYRSWKIQLLNHFEIYPELFGSERSKLSYVFRSTSGMAQEMLEPRMDPASPIRFRTVEEMLETLDIIFEDVNEQVEKRREYSRLLMSDTETFWAFKNRFLVCADRAQIPLSVRQEDLYQKLEPSLQLQLAPIRADLTSFASFCTRAHGIYQDTATAKERLRSLQARKAVAVASTPQRKKSRELAKESSVVEVRSKSALTARVERSAPPSAVPPKGNCYNCGDPEHYATGCPFPRELETALKLLELSSLGLIES